MEIWNASPPSDGRLPGPAPVAAGASLFWRRAAPQPSAPRRWPPTPHRSEGRRDRGAGGRAQRGAQFARLGQAASVSGAPGAGAPRGGGGGGDKMSSLLHIVMKRESQCAEPLALRRLGAVGVAVRVFGSCWLPVSCSAPSGDVTSDGRGEQVGPRRVGVCHVQICSGRTAAANKSSRGGCVCVLHSCESAVESEGRRGGRAS